MSEKEKNISLFIDVIRGGVMVRALHSQSWISLTTIPLSCYCSGQVVCACATVQVIQFSTGHYIVVYFSLD